jgi:hypothetical protein
LAVGFRWWNLPDISSTRTLDGGVTVAKKKAAKKVAKKAPAKKAAKKASKKCCCK